MALGRCASLIAAWVALAFGGCVGPTGTRRPAHASSPASQGEQSVAGVRQASGDAAPGPMAPTAPAVTSDRSARDTDRPPSEPGVRTTQPAAFPVSAAELPSRIPAEDSSTQLRRLYTRAMERYSTIDSYIARLRRREQVNGRDKPEELLLFKFRKQPWSVYFKWLGSESAGREVVYVKGHYGDAIHTLLAAGDMPLVPAGRRMALAPDNIFVRSASRHAITEAGIGYLIEQFGTLVDAPKGEDGRAAATYLGRQRRSDVDVPLDAAEQIIAPRREPQLPHGGRRLWMFSPDDGLPVLVITTDHTGHEVEYYCYDRLQYPLHLDDSDFDPDQLWAPSRRELAPEKQIRAH
jgi:hypothetical protein